MRDERNGDGDGTGACASALDAHRALRSFRVHARVRLVYATSEGSESASHGHTSACGKIESGRVEMTREKSAVGL